MTPKYMPIKLFFTEFSHMKYMKSERMYLLALYDGILLTQHPKSKSGENHSIENQSGATYFFTYKTLGFKRTAHARLC